MVRCYTNMEQIEKAGVAFHVICSDPKTQLLGAIPLAWGTSPTPPQLVRVATEWLDDTEPPLINLIGASWLMTSPQRPDALTTLAKLAESSDPRTAQLAEAQLWRDQLVTATVEDIAGWAAKAAAMEETLQAGPQFLIGQGWTRHGRHTDAALALMRVPVLFPKNKELAAEALLAAGQQLEKMGDHSGAKSVYQELLRSCPNHRLAPVAKQRLERTNAD